MIRFAWRQFRGPAIVATGVLAMVGVALALTGPHLYNLYGTGFTACTRRGNCSGFNAAFAQNDGALRTWLGVLVLVVPGIVGVFWGAPLVSREFETGTHRLAWTQSITRSRWLLSKMMVVGTAGAVFSGVLSLMVTWWSSRIDTASMNIYGTFDARDIVPVGYAVFGFTLGVTAGVALRKVLPAMASTLLVFASVRLAFNFFVRPKLVAPRFLSIPLDQNTAGFGSANRGPFTLFPNAPTLHNTWIRSVQIVNRTHQTLTSHFVAQVCHSLVAQSGGEGQRTGLGGLSPTRETNRLLQECFSRIGVSYHVLVAYQPPSQYWTMQWYETGIYIVLSVGLALICARSLRRRAG